jgi:hypothetical protein
LPSGPVVVIWSWYHAGHGCPATAAACGVPIVGGTAVGGTAVAVAGALVAVGSTTVLVAPGVAQATVACFPLTEPTSDVLQLRVSESPGLRLNVLAAAHTVAGTTRPTPRTVARIDSRFFDLDRRISNVFCRQSCIISE